MAYSHIAAFYYSEALKGGRFWNVAIQMCAAYRNMSK